MKNFSSNTLGRSRLHYEIREIMPQDILTGRYLEAIENLAVQVPDVRRALEVLLEIESNPLHKVFVAVYKNLVLGSLTLLVEPKFIYSGGRVGHIEDVVVRKDQMKRGIGGSLVKFALDVARRDFHCTKIILDCSNENKKFYEIFGFSHKDNCMAILWK